MTEAATEGTEQVPDGAPEATGTEVDKGDGATPPWGDDFNPEKAWEKIQKANREAANLRQRVITPEQQQRLDEYARLEAASKSDLERIQEERDRWQTEADRWRTSSVTSKIESLAANDFAYPADAVGKLDPNNYLDAGGVIDEAAIKRDLAAILEERPNWRRQSEAPKSRVPAPRPEQGSAGGTPVVDPRQEFAAILQGQLNKH